MQIMRRSALLITVFGSLLVCASASASSPLLGQQTVAGYQDRAGAGFMQAFGYTAGATGSTADVQVYIGSSNTATSLAVGLYSDAGGKPGTLIAHGSRSSLSKSAWNDVAVTSTPITAGTRYWIALLGNGGTLYFRDVGSGTPGSYGEQVGSTLPASWSTWPYHWNSGPASAYVNGSTVAASGGSGNTSPQSSSVSSTPQGAAGSCPVAQPQTTWAPVGRPPLSDAQAAACVQDQPETRAGNAQYNNYVPSSAEELAWQSARSINEHQPTVKSVDGLDGLSNPSTDDLIQWASYKWGIPADWVRAEAVVESHWRETATGDLTSVSASDYPSYPALSHYSGVTCTSNCQVWRSLGLMQVSWTTGNTPGYGTEPLRWKSTAFNLDYYASVVRWYYDGDCSWCGAGYSAGQPWPSIGGWYDPYPWQNSGARDYESQVQTNLNSRTWAQPGF